METIAKLVTIRPGAAVKLSGRAPSADSRPVRLLRAPRAQRARVADGWHGRERWS